MKNKLGLKWGDFILFALILGGACLIWMRFAMIQTDNVYGEIWKDGELYERVQLADGYQNTITVPGKASDSIIEIDGKRMRFIQSKCSDHTCERTGWVERVGETAVCLPNRTLIKIARADGSTDNADGIDAVVQ